jgi:hypothetical protein
MRDEGEDWVNALKHVPSMIGTEKRVFDFDTLTLRDGQWISNRAGEEVTIVMQAFEFTGDDISIASCMRHLNNIVAQGVKQISFAGGTLFIRQPFWGDDDVVCGRYGVVLRCK